MRATKGQSKNSPMIDSYYFYPPKRSHAPGSPRLDIIIRDPEERPDLQEEYIVRVQMPIAGNKDSYEQVIFSHPWPSSEASSVCAGLVRLSTDKNQTISAFTFGGDLHINSEENSTALSINSSAPILKLEEFNSIPTILANEVAILLGERRAGELPDIELYKKKLVCVDPLTLYCACLVPLEKKFSETSYSETPSLSSFHLFLESEIESLHRENLWPKYLPELEDLL